LRNHKTTIPIFTIGIVGPNLLAQFLSMVFPRQPLVIRAVQTKIIVQPSLLVRL
jgi:hypothetical protein